VLHKACRPSLCRVALALTLAGSGAAWGQGATFNITSSPNPVGSGARALGMGAAFISIADDATAASWNPGGLTQLERPELSLVYSWKSFGEDFESSTHPELSNDHEVDLSEINYASAVYPLRRTIAGRNVVFSLNYLTQYNFDRDLKLRLHQNTALSTTTAGVSTSLDYSQRGSIASLSPAFAIELTDTLSVGVTWNIYDQSLLPDNEWKVRQTERRQVRIGGIPTGPPAFLSQKEDFDNFDGQNFTFGALWKPNSRWGVGAVYHTGYDADVDYSITTITSAGFYRHRASKQTITFPKAYGVGVSYRFPNDRLTLSLDITRREWDEFRIRDPYNPSFLNKYRSGVTGQPMFLAPEIDATHTVRLGAEYVFVDDKSPEQNFMPSLRAGIFYDPEPASGRKTTFLDYGFQRWDRGDGSVDNFYGVTLGVGVLMYDRVNLDFAYIYRWGDGVRQDTLNLSGTDTDVEQHQFYLSTVIYF
jgi:long-subunit fatty acid transport protein